MFEIGDEVIIVGPDIPPNETITAYKYDGKCYYYTNDMNQFLGLTATVSDMSHHSDLPNCYYLKDIYGFYWHQNWLRPAKEYDEIKENDLMNMFE